jgi:Helix-turn-helix domain
MMDDQLKREMMVGAIQERRDIGPLPANPPPGPKWQAKKGLYRLGLNGTEHAVIGCLIDRANQHTGNCYPSVDFIARWTFRPERTIKLALASLRVKGLFVVIDRGTSSNAYLINWQLLFSAYREILAVENGNKERHLTKTCPTRGAETCPTSLQKPAPKPWKVEPWKVEPRSLSAPSDDGAYLVILNGKEGFQEEPTCRPTPFPQSPVPLEGPKGLSREAAERGVSSYLTTFDRQHLSAEAFEAALVAEMEAPGSGRAVVKAASQEAWRARRKGVVNE